MGSKHTKQEMTIVSQFGDHISIITRAALSLDHNKHDMAKRVRGNGYDDQRPGLRRLGSRVASVVVEAVEALG